MTETLPTDTITFHNVYLHDDGIHYALVEQIGEEKDTDQNVYLHVTKEMKKEASQKFAELMRSLD